MATIPTGQQQHKQLHDCIRNARNTSRKREEYALSGVENNWVMTIYRRVPGSRYLHVRSMVTLSARSDRREQFGDVSAASPGGHASVKWHFLPAHVPLTTRAALS